MLAYVLALAVGLGSIALYLAAFFFPEIHRKNDLIWSGVGLFYALVLWVFAQRITGGLLLGHVASVALLGWFGWQTLSLRRQLTPQAQQTQLPSPEALKTTIQEQVSKLSVPERLTQLQKGVGSAFSGAKTDEKTKTPTTTDTPVLEIVDQRTSAPEQVPSDTEAISPSPPSTELVGAAKEGAEDKTPSLPVVEVSPSAETQPHEVPPLPPVE